MMKKTSSLSRQIKTTILVSVITVALIIAYFTVLSPLLNSVAEVDTAPVLLEGESLGTSNRIFIHEYLNTDSIESISVKNEYGEYAISADEDDNFYIVGNKAAPYNSAMFSALCVATGYSLSLNRIVPALDDGTEPEFIDYSVFGLDEDNCKASYTITSKAGKSYTVYIGYEIGSGQGYYARLEGRNAIYTVAKDLDTTVLAPIEKIITPMITIPTSTTEYYKTDYFSLWKDGEHYLTIRYLTSDEEKDRYAIESSYIMALDQNVSIEDVLDCETTKQLMGILGTNKLDYAFTPAIDEYAEVLQSFSDYEGEEVVEMILPETPDMTEENLMNYAMELHEKLAKYGIDSYTPAFELFFNYQGINNYVMFSHLSDDGYYYSFNYAFGLVIKVSTEKAGFLDWNLAQWVEPAFFQRNITKIGEITVESDGVDADFVLTHDADAKDNTDKLTVFEKNSNRTVDTQNFRQFYKVLLSRLTRGEATIGADDEMIGSFSVTTIAGVKTTYRFYRSSTQRVTFTINDEGGFYTLSDSVRKLFSDAAKVVEGITVESEADE